ncbi:MAG: SusC/RagA family TonB-linked outer membrane protein, partial [Bacteroidales bacterium]|nr:SusC/RagA family TonB-linked outer membrane protein [Bacteroidales bacterium]
MNFTNTELIRILDKIEQESGYFFLFNEKLIDTRQKISINVTDMLISNLLDILFKSTKIKYSIIDNKIILSPDYLEFDKRQISVSGIATDENGTPMPGVNVQIEGTTTGIITDMNGRYSLNVSNPDEAVLIFSFIGYNQRKVPLTGRASVNVSMEPLISNLEEVIVVGYGTIRKADLTGSITALDDDQYRAQPVTRVDDIMQGRSAGVNVTTISGAPGGTTSIRIRGSNSITGSNEPLYVIDGFVGGDISTVNPTDIGSIQILKDASSTAIYGSRGANGVVLITTKSGTAGESRLTISSRYYLSNPIGKWPLLNANEFVTVVNERADALGYDHRYTDEEVNYWKTHEGTDWQDEIFRTAGGKEVQLDYSGGSDRITYFVSGNFLDQDGIIINSDYRRYSLRTNVNAKLSDKLNSSLKVNFARRETNNVSGTFSTLGIVGTAIAWSPTTPVYDENGQFTTYDPISSIKTNPVEQAMNEGINEINNFSTNGNFVYKIIEGLTLDVGFGVNYSNQQGKTFNLSLQSASPSASRSSTENLFLQNTNNLTYTRTFYDIHNITVTAVAEYQWQQQDIFSATANKLLFPSLKYNNISLAESYSLTNSIEKSTIGSYIGRINYSFRNRYLITASLRSDRSSKFRAKNQKSFFPSIGLGWRISEENFMQSMDFISNLKLRASWGETGSQAINVYGTVTS